MYKINPIGNVSNNIIAPYVVNVNKVSDKVRTMF